MRNLLLLIGGLFLFIIGESQSVIEPLNKNSGNVEKKIDSLHCGDLYQRAIIRNRTGNYKGAISVCNRIISSCEDNVLGYRLRGIANSLLQNFNLAIEDFNLAKEKEPLDHISLLYLSRALFAIEQDMEAMETIDNSINLKIDYFDAYIFRGIMKMKKKLYDEAIKDFEKAMSINPQNGDLYFYIGFAKGKQLKIEESCSYIEKAKKLGSAKIDNKILEWCRNR